MITYKLVNGLDGNLSSISKRIDGIAITSIPIINDNTDYQEYLEWVAEGNTPEEAE